MSWGWVVCTPWDTTESIKRKKIIPLERSVVLEGQWTAIFAPGVGIYFLMCEDLDGGSQKHWRSHNGVEVGEEAGWRQFYNFSAPLAL